MIGKDIAEYWYPYQLNYLDNALERLEVANVQSDLHRLWILEGYIKSLLTYWWYSPIMRNPKQIWADTHLKGLARAWGLNTPVGPSQTGWSLSLSCAASPRCPPSSCSSTSLQRFTRQQDDVQRLLLQLALLLSGSSLPTLAGGRPVRASRQRAGLPRSGSDHPHKSTGWAGYPTLHHLGSVAAQPVGRHLPRLTLISCWLSVHLAYNTTSALKPFALLPHSFRYFFQIYFFILDNP